MGKLRCHVCVTKMLIFIFIGTAEEIIVELVQQDHFPAAMVWIAAPFAIFLVQESASFDLIGTATVDCCCAEPFSVPCALYF